MKNPSIIKTLTDLTEVSELVNSYFKDAKKTTIWLNSDNPLLGGLQPVEMVFQGRTEKLLNFIKTALDENTR